MEKPRGQPRISIVAAIGAHDRAIGRNNELLWHISDDLKRFKALTFGHPVIMGRKTFESIVGYLGKPLSGRQNIVVTRDTSYAYPGVVVTHSLDDALAKARELDDSEVFIEGGGDIWNQALPHVGKLYLTLIDDVKQADAFFPPYEAEFTKEAFREERQTDDGLRYIWIDLER